MFEGVFMNIEAYNKNYPKIFDERKLKRVFGEVYVKDGVVNPELWFSQKIRPLFLLKEAYGGREDWSLLDHLIPVEENEMACGATWRRVTQWTYGILGTDETNIPIFDINEMPALKYGNELLKHISVVNVKKTAGNTKSEMDEINRVAKRDRFELQKQIALCSPTVIICGYTMEALNIIMSGESDKGIKDYSCPNQNWYYKFELNGQEVIAIDYYHPSNQFPDLLNYYALMHIYQMALRDNRKADFKIDVKLAEQI